MSEDKVQIKGLVRVGDTFWEITGIHIGALKQQSAITVRPIGLGCPAIYGKTIQEFIIPDKIINTLILYKRS